MAASGPGSRHRTPTVHKAPRKLDEVRSDINVTPLVDVCLVLLIIFMVVLDKLARGMEVNLPRTQHHEKHRDTGEDLIISVMRDGSRTLYFWDRDRIPDLDTLETRIGDEFRRKSRPVFLKADTDMPYRDVYPALIAIHQGGAQNVRLAVTERKEQR
jgi:biopolymer transport protein TolR